MGKRVKKQSERNRRRVVRAYYAAHDITQEYNSYGHLWPGCSLYRDGDLGVDVPRMKPNDKEYHELRVRLGVIDE